MRRDPVVYLAVDIAALLDSVEQRHRVLDEARKDERLLQAQQRSWGGGKEGAGSRFFFTEDSLLIPAGP